LSKTWSTILPALALASLATTSPWAADGDLLARDPVALEVESLAAGAEDAPRERIEALLDDLGGAIELSRITYESDGLKVRGYLASPKEGEALPCVIFNRGGNREFGALDDLRALYLLGVVAARDYVVVASQYRGNGGGEGREEFGGAEVNDILNLIPLLEKLPRADASRIGMFGWSRGGMMTYLALARTDRMRAAIVGAGVADSFETVEARPEMEKSVYAELVPDWKEWREQALVERSAIRWPEKLAANTPILILHGTGDWRVSPTQSLRMAEALFELRRPYRLMMFEGGDHGLSEFRDEVNEAVGAWLDRYVRDGERWPSLEPHGR
jgi:dipeptidyl aminopeptidase/acylaminoacyl peptidase